MELQTDAVPIDIQTTGNGDFHVKPIGCVDIDRCHLSDRPLRGRNVLRKAPRGR